MGSIVVIVLVLIGAAAVLAFVGISALMREHLEEERLEVLRDHFEVPVPDGSGAVLGAPELSGVWQRTGDKFEVMFYMHEPVGKFYIRERVDIELNQ